MDSRRTEGAARAGAQGNALGERASRCFQSPEGATEPKSRVASRTLSGRFAALRGHLSRTRERR